MREPQAKAIHLKDYAPPAFRVDTVELDVDIRDDHALVRAKLQVVRNSPGPLVLDGDELELVSVQIDGKPVAHAVTAESLTIPDVPDAFALETLTRIVPQQNTKLEGL
ncbi:MAG TPA: aminopeptidase N, partial [Burkholderiales bacterium]